MRRFPGDWAKRSWWSVYSTSTASKRRVLRRLREEGPLESADFERRRRESRTTGYFGGDAPLPKEDKRSLQLLWHAGRVAVRERRHFRRVYDLAERVYPEGHADSPVDSPSDSPSDSPVVSPIASAATFEDSWLLIGLGGNGVAPERHLANYVTGPALKAPQRKRALRRNLASGRIVEVVVEGLRGLCYALPEHLDRLAEAPPPEGTTLICPFDSLLWQRRRAEELLDFHYRVEIYVPQAKRRFGYYVLPVLHNGRLIGRLDPKLHRESERLEIRGVFLEPDVPWDDQLARGLREALESLAEFVGARTIELPRGWRRKLG